MTSDQKNGIESVLQDVFHKMNADQAQAIREAYYKAIEGLTTLAHALEIAELEVGESNDHVLIKEHLVACEAIETMEKSLLGRIL